MTGSPESPPPVNENIRRILEEEDDDDWHSPIRDACDLRALKSRDIGPPRGGYVILERLEPPPRKAVEEVLKRKEV